MENHIVLNPLRKQLFQVEQPSQSRPRISLIRALWVRFIVWASKATLADVRRAILRALWCVGIPAGVLSPWGTLDAVQAAAEWRHGALPIMGCAFLVLFHWKTALRWYRRQRLLKDRPDNQHTLHGAPIGMLTDFLKANGSFKRDSAIRALRISQPQYGKIAEALKQAGILVHGENNAHVMREIGRTLLSHQLEDIAEGRYPRYKYDEERDLWYERDGMAGRFMIDQEFKKRQLEEKQDRKIERKKREVEKLEEVIEERTLIADDSPLAHIFGHAPHSAL